MTTQEVPVNGQTVVNVLMSEDTQNLEEVVVIGYGTSKAKDLTAPIAVIKADEITKHATSSPMSALQGKVPGVQITNSGQPGSGPSVRIRGIGSMNTDSQPLYVVDGMFFDNIDFLNNSDIQDLSILKDASAASIYGVRAANGVVLVTTKKGALNRPATVTYDGYVGFQKATNVLKMANSEQYATMISEMGNETLQAVVNNAKNVWGTLPNTNWYDENLHTALTHNHSLDISGGTEKATYSVGTSYLYQDGILDSKNDYSRFNLRTKADYKAFDWLKVGANVVLSNSTQNLPNGEVWLAAFRTPGIIPVYDENSSLNPYPTKYLGSGQWVGFSFGWMALLQIARSNGNGALYELHRFAEHFLSRNGFHLNGDYKNSGVCDFHYRPFTLEADFLAAHAVQKMLLRSEKNHIEVLPACPQGWKNEPVAFQNLRAENGLLISYQRTADGKHSLTVKATQDGSWYLCNTHCWVTLQAGQTQSYQWTEENKK